MGIHEIPKAYEYVCDNCGAKHLQENASGHYSNSLPPHWSRFKFSRNGYDYQGAAVADASFERLLCEECTNGLLKVITIWGGA